MWNNKCQGRQGWGKLNDLHIFAIAEVGSTKSQLVPDVYYIGGFYINSLLTVGLYKDLLVRNAKLTYLCLFYTKYLYFLTGKVVTCLRVL